MKRREKGLSVTESIKSHTNLLGESKTSFRSVTYDRARKSEHVHLGEAGLKDGLVGEYLGDVGLNDGDCGLYRGDVGENEGEVGEYRGLVGE